MSKTRIEWVRNEDGTQGYTINPVKGLCPVGCSYCYARRMYDRFRWNSEIRFDNTPLLQFYDYRTAPPAGSKIFIGSTIELFGEWVKPEWLKFIFQNCKTLSNRTFIFLTKLPHNLKQWNPFPSNCGVGVTVTTNGDMTNAMTNLAGIIAGYRFLSVEPFLGDLGMNDHMSMKGIVDQIIIGSQTQPVKHPRREWVESLISKADKYQIPIFIKEPLASYMNIQRQEFPRT